MTYVQDIIHLHNHNEREPVIGAIERLPYSGISYIRTRAQIQGVSSQTVL